MNLKKVTPLTLLLALLILSACEFPSLPAQEEAAFASDTPASSPTERIVASSWTPSPTGDGETAQPTQKPTSEQPVGIPIGIDNLDQIAVQTSIESDLDTTFSALDLSNDGRYLAFAQWGDPGVDVRVWDFQETQLLPPLDFHKANVIDVAFSPDGKWLASCSQYGEVALWDVGSWELGDSFSTYARGASALAFSPDSSLLAVGGERNQLGVWRLADFERVNYFEWSGPHRVDKIIFTADGSLYYADTGYADITARNTSDGELVRSFRGEACIGGFDLSSDESKLAYSSECSAAQAPHESLARVAVRDIETGEALVYGDRKDTNTIVYFTADDSLILTNSGPTLRFWDATDGSLVDQWSVGVYWFEFMFSQDGSLLFIGGPSGVIRIYAVEASAE